MKAEILSIETIEKIARIERENNQLQQENKQLKDNWNELKEYFKFLAIDNYEKPKQNKFIECYNTKDIFNKIQELEKGDSNE